MSRAATKTGTRKRTAMEVEQLHAAARRQFPDAPGRTVAAATRELHRIAKAGRLRIGPRP